MKGGPKFTYHIPVSSRKEKKRDPGEDSKYIRKHWISENINVNN